MEKFLSDPQKAGLQKGHRKAKQMHDANQADRIKAILMLNNGYTFFQVAESLLLDDETIPGVTSSVTGQNGIQGLNDAYQGGGSYLSAEQKMELKAHLKDMI